MGARKNKYTRDGEEVDYGCEEEQSQAVDYGRRDGDPTAHNRRRRKLRRIRSVVITWLVVAALVVAVPVAAVFFLRQIGKDRLRNIAGNAAPNLPVDEMDGQGEAVSSASGSGQDLEATEETAAGNEEQPAWQEGWVRHEGKIYEFNKEILTFLVMGIDKDSEVEDNPDAYSGGQADALFLVAADPTEKRIRIIAVNRDTEVDVKLYDVHAQGYEQTVRAPIAVQHSFGDGREFSCELTEDAVSALFYDLPINGYVAVNMAAIQELNDAIGGVGVTVLEDLTKKNPAWKKGAEVFLKGADAFWYVKWRDTTIFESNRGRLARQKQYLGNFMRSAVEAVKRDLTLPVTLYRKLGKYMVTDISIDEVAYLAGELLDYSFDLDEIYTLEGETGVVDGYERFYPDREALRDLVVEVFYKEVDPSGS